MKIKYDKRLAKLSRKVSTLPKQSRKQILAKRRATRNGNIEAGLGKK